MINLLPDKLKEGYRYARRNKHLVRWAVALFVVLVGAVGVAAVGYLYLEQSTKQYANQIEVSRERLKKQNYDVIEKEIKDMSNNLNLSVQVLSKQVLFSELLTQLGSVMPRDTRLTSLNISQTKGALDIVAVAKTYQAASQITVNLSDTDSKIFSQADLIGVSCTEKSVNGYPCRVTVRALFADDNPFLFINDKTTTTAKPKAGGVSR